MQWQPNIPKLFGFAKVIRADVKENSLDLKCIRTNQENFYLFHLIYSHLI